MITFLRDRMWWIDTITLSHLSLGPYIALPTQYSICFSGSATWATLTRTCRRRRRPSLVIRLPSECVRTSHNCCAAVIRVKCLLEATAHDFNALHWFHSICLSGCLHHSPLCDVCGHAFSAMLDISWQFSDVPFSPLNRVLSHPTLFLISSLSVSVSVSLEFRSNPIMLSL